MQIVYILTTLLIISFLIIVHEFGHYLAARMMGVRVLEFAIGMGPAIYKRQGEKTLFSIRLLPIGGYCSMQGEVNVPEEEQGSGGMENERIEETDSLEESEEGEETEAAKEAAEDLDPSEDFLNKKPWQRIIILAAGVTMNFIVGFIVIYVAFLFAGQNPIEAFARAWPAYLNMYGLIFTSLKMLFTGEATVGDFTGPIGMVQIVGSLFTEGAIVLMIFTAMLSVNLGIINLIPLPALDGGQIVMTLFETVKKGGLSWRVKYVLMLASYFLLITLMVFIAYNDVARMAVGS